MRRESADFIGARSEAEAPTRPNVELQPILFFEDSKVWRKGGRSCRQIYFGLRRIRALSVGFPYALTTAILGGTTDLSRCGSRRPATSRTSSGTSQSGPPYRCSSIYECLKPMSGERQ
jgi:hypothetical protein